MTTSPNNLLPCPFCGIIPHILEKENLVVHPSLPAVCPMRLSPIVPMNVWNTRTPSLSTILEPTIEMLKTIGSKKVFMDQTWVSTGEALWAEKEIQRLQSIIKQQEKRE